MFFASTNIEDDLVHETIFNNDVKSEVSSVNSLTQQMPEAVNEDINKMNFVAAWLQTSNIPKVIYIKDVYYSQNEEYV